MKFGIDLNNRSEKIRFGKRLLGILLLIALLAATVAGCRPRGG